jgi:hypothetical protein
MTVINRSSAACFPTALSRYTSCCSAAAAGSGSAKKRAAIAPDADVNADAGAGPVAAAAVAAAVVVSGSESRRRLARSSAAWTAATSVRSAAAHSSSDAAVKRWRNPARVGNAGAARGPEARADDGRIRGRFAREAEGGRVKPAPALPRRPPPPAAVEEAPEEEARANEPESGAAGSSVASVKREAIGVAGVSATGDGSGLAVTGPALSRDGGGRGL